MADHVRKLVIIGSGPAGYTAALYAARANLAPLVYAGEFGGGQLALTTAVENYPGFLDGIAGSHLMVTMRLQAERFGAEVRDCDVTAVDLTRRPFQITTDQETEYAHALVVATGAAARRLGVPGEERYRGYGVSSCATWDGDVFRNKRIVVVGGGDGAMEEAIALSRVASALTIVHRRGRFRASMWMQDRIFVREGIGVIRDTIVTEVLGEPHVLPARPYVTGVRLRNMATGAEAVLATDALFVAIGSEPNTAIFGEQLRLDDRGYLRTLDPGSTATAVEGVFAADAVRDPRYRQAVTAAGDGCKAAMDAERWLEERGLARVTSAGHGALA